MKIEKMKKKKWKKKRMKINNENFLKSIIGLLILLYQLCPPMKHILCRLNDVFFHT